MLNERETDALETMFTAGRRAVRASRACKQLKSARARGSTLRTYTLSITVHSLEAGITHLVLHEGSLKRVLSAQACRVREGLHGPELREHASAPRSSITLSEWSA
jgi:hypothetical protein